MAKKPATKTAVVKKAQAASKASAKGTVSKTKAKVRTSVHFRRPKTLQLQRNPKYAHARTLTCPHMRARHAPNTTSLHLYHLVCVYCALPSLRPAIRRQNLDPHPPEPRAIPALPILSPLTPAHPLCVQFTVGS